MMYILTKQFLGGEILQMDVILKKNDLEFERYKSKKSLVFVELLCDFPNTDTEIVVQDSLADESLFLISMSDPWYADIITYLQTQNFRPELSRTDLCHIRYQSQQYNIVGDTLYCHSVDSIFR